MIPQPEIHQFAGDAGDSRILCRRSRQRALACDGLEIVASDLDGDTTGDETLRTKSPRHLIAEGGELCMHRGRRMQILRKRSLVADGSLVVLGDDGACVDSRCATAPRLGMSSEEALQDVRWRVAKIADRDEPGCGDGGAQLPTESGQSAHGQRIEDSVNAICRDDRESIGLVEIGSDFGDELVGGHPHRGGESRPFADPLLDVASDTDLVAE